jgi:hypothetical protein
MLTFPDAVQGLRKGDFSRLAPLLDGSPSPIELWYDRFDDGGP